MRILERHSEHDIEVYGIYWSDFQGRLERHHFIIPEEGYPGFLTVPESECEVTNPNIRNFILVKNSINMDMLIHPSAYADSLLDRLIDHDSIAMDLFLERLRIFDLTLSDKK